MPNKLACLYLTGFSSSLMFVSKDKSIHWSGAPERSFTHVGSDKHTSLSGPLVKIKWNEYLGLYHWTHMSGSTLAGSSPGRKHKTRVEATYRAVLFTIVKKFYSTGPSTRFNSLVGVKVSKNFQKF